MIKFYAVIAKNLILSSLFLIPAISFSQCPAGTTYTVTNTNDSGAGSLREAIGCVNGDLALDNIAFAIPGAGPHTIFLISLLPDVSDEGVTIDGFTQGGGLGNVILDGGNSVTAGITLVANQCTVRGMKAQNFPSAGFQLDDVNFCTFDQNCSVNNFYGIFIGRGPLCNNHTISNNLIGVDENGLSGANNIGIQIFGCFSNLFVGNTFAFNSIEGLGYNGGGNEDNEIQGGSFYCNATGISGSQSINAVPTISSAQTNLIDGTTDPNETVAVYLQNNSPCGTAACQGATLLGTTTANGTGNWSISGSFTTTLASGDIVTATSTSTTGSTSPFSSCATVIASICNHPDFDALMALYNSTNGAGWTNNTGWVGGAAGTDCDPCNWYGILCDGNDRVIGIDLDGKLDFQNYTWGFQTNNLNGSLPAELGDLPFLERLYLSGSQFTGSIPAQLGNLSALQVLRLDQTGLTGGIPPSLGQLTNLQHLLLSDNQLTGSIPPEFGNMSSLQRMFLNTNMLNGAVPDELGNLLNLVFLNLMANQFSGQIPAALGNLQNITYFRLDNNDFSGCLPPELLNLCATVTNGGIANNPNLDTESWGNFCNFNEGVCIVPCAHPDFDALMALYNSTNGPSWTNNSGWVDGAAMANCDPCTWYGIQCDGNGRVIKVDLDGNPTFTSNSSGGNNLNGLLPAELGSLTTLQELYLSANALLGGEIPTELGNLSNLTDLNLFSNSHSGTIPLALGNLTNLRVLGLATNNLIGTIPVELANLINLERLNLSVNQLNGSIPPQLGNLSNLEQLGLSSNNLTNNLPVELGDLISLERLILAANSFTGNIPSELGNLSNLMAIDFSYNNFSGSIPVALGNLSNLSTLDLDDTNISGSIPAVLGNLSNLSTLDLSNNNLTGEIPPEIGDLANLTTLDLSANDLSGCYHSNLLNLCATSLVETSNNPQLPWQGDFSQFCATDGSQAAQIGAFCDDSNGATIGESIQPDCSCAFVSACPPPGSITVIVTNTDDDGSGSLREAINCANADPDLDNIIFDIPGIAPHTISLLSELPTIFDEGVIINGLANGNNIGDIILQGSGSGEGFFFVADNCQVTGIRIVQFHYGIQTSNPVSNCTFSSNVVGLCSQGIVLGSGANPTGQNNVIDGNYVGTDQFGSLGLGNTSDGIRIQSNNASIINNVIANNARWGVQVDEGQGNSILNNTIYCNDGDGIFVDPTGVNGGITPPVISSATTQSITGTGVANATIQVFINDDQGCTGAPCQGRTFLGTTTANAIGNWSLAGIYTQGEMVTATTTDASNNTSEFSACATVTNNCPDIFTAVPLAECNDIVVIFDLTQADLELTGGTAGLTVNWYTDAAATQPIADPTNYFYNGLTNPVYARTFDGNCESESIQSIDLVIQGTPSSSEPTLPASACVGELISVAVNISGGTPPYSGSFTIGGQLVETFNNFSGGIYSFSFSLNTPGNYDYNQFEFPFIQDADDCSFFGDLIYAGAIDIIGGLTGTIPPPIEACEVVSGQALFDLTSVESIVSNGSGVPVDWYQDFTLNFPIADPTQYPSASSTVFAVLDNGGCTSAPVPVDLVLHLAPLPQLLDLPASACVGEEITINVPLTGIGGTPPYSGQIEVGGSVVASFSNTSGAYVSTFVLNVPGNYEYSNIDLVDANGCAPVIVLPDMSNIEILANPIAFTPSTSVVSCNIGNNEGFFDLTQLNNEILQGGSGQVLWYQTPDLLTEISFPNNYVGLAGNVAAVVDNGGCLSNVVSATLLILEPEPAQITGDLNLCLGDATVLSVTENYISYTWSTNASSPTITVSQAGIYGVTVMDQNGCLDTDEVEVVPALPPVVEIIASIDGLCPGETATLTATPGYASYMWSTNSITNSIEVSQIDFYNVTVTDGAGCQTVEDYFMDGSPAMTVDCQGATPVSSPGASDGSVTISLQGGTPNYTISWTGAQTGSFFTNNSGNTAINGLAAGSYQVVVEDEFGCTMGCTFSISSPDDELILNIFGAYTSCLDSPTGGIDLTAIGGTPPYQVNWIWLLGDDSGSVIISNPGDVVSIAPLWFGEYELQLTDNGNPINTVTDTFTIDAVPDLGVSMDYVHPSCFDETDGMVTAVVLQDGIPPNDLTGFTFNWNVTSDNVQTLTNIPSGFYAVTVTDGNGCSTVQASTTVSQPPQLRILPSNTTIQDATCSGSFDGAIAITPTGGTTANGDYLFEWDNGLGTIVGPSTQVSNLDPGEYCVTITDDNGCESTDCFIVAAVKVLSANVIVTDVSCNGDCDGEIFVSGFTAGAPADLPYNFTWSSVGDPPVNTDITSSLTGLCAGSYFLTLSDSDPAGCQIIETIDISEPEVLEVSLLDQVNETCIVGNDGSITIGVTGGIYPYDYTWDDLPMRNDSIAVGLSANTYGVTVTDANGCEVSGSFLVQVPDGVDVDCNVISDATPGQSDGEAELTISGGAPDYDLTMTGPTGTNSFTTGPSTLTFSALLPGTYQITGSDSNGCPINCGFTIGGGSVGTCNRTQDSLALVALYNETGGADWTYTATSYNNATGVPIPNAGNSWDFDEPIDTWHGVELNSEGCVRVLALNRNGLVGSLIDLQLPNLELFTIYVNDVAGIIPNFTNLPNLELLNCGHNDFTGGIPNFTHLLNLERFYCENNNLTGTIPNFTHLPNLKRFNCSINDLNGTIPNFTHVPNLEAFDCQNDNLTGSIPDFTNIPNLWFFSCSLNNLTGPIPDFTNLPNLRNFGCQFNNLTGNIPDFTNTPVLEIYLCNHNNLTGSIPDFTDMPKLEYFWCHVNNLSGGIPDFTNTLELEDFQCHTNNLTGVIPDFTNLPVLNRFECHTNNLSDSIPDFTNLSSLIVFSCHTNNLSGSIPDFTNLPNLEIFECHANSLSGSIPEFANLPNLGEFSCFSNDLSGLVPDFSDNCPLLRLLYTDSNQLTFEDVLPYISFNETLVAANAEYPRDTLSYAPQDSIFTDTLIFALEGNPLIIDLGIDDTVSTNVYTWDKDDLFYQAINGNNELNFASLQMSDAGVYKVVITNPNAPELTLYSYDITIVISPMDCADSDLTAALTDSQGPNCSISDNGYAEVVALLGQPPYSYFWSNGDTTAIATDLEAQEYTVTLTDSEGCFDSAFVSLTALNPIVLTCPGDLSIMIEADSTGILLDIPAPDTGGCPLDSLHYHLEGSTTAMDQAGAVGIQFFNIGLTTVTYFVPNGDTCSFVVDVQQVTDLCSDMTIFGNQIQSPACSDGADGFILMTASGGDANYDYAWSNGADTEDLSGLSDGLYVVTVTDGNNCEVSASFWLQTSEPFVDLCSAIPVSAPGQSDGLLSIAFIGGAPPYDITYTGPVSGILENQPFGGAVVFDVPEGTYSITITDNNLCTSTCTITVTSLESCADTLACQDLVNILLGNDCQRLISTDIVLEGDYGCLSPDDFTINVLDDNPGNGPILDGVGTFQYEVMCTGPNCATANFTNCSGTLNALDSGEPVFVDCPESLIVNVAAWETGAIVNDLTPFAEDNCSVPTITYELSGATIGNGNDDASGTFFNVGITQLSYMAQDDSGISSSCIRTVEVIPGPINCDLLILEVALQAELCQEANGQLVATVAGGSGGYLYLLNDAIFTGSAGDLSSGTYTVEVLDTLTGCLVTETLVLDNIGVSVTTTLDTTICQGQSYQVGTSSYEETGTYTDTLQTVDGCDSMVQLNLMVEELGVTITGDTSFCEGTGTNILQVDILGATYVWSTGSSASFTSIGPLLSMVSVTVTNANGCMGSDTVQIENFDNPVVTISGELIACEADVTAVTASGGAIYLWSTGDTTAQALLPTGSHSVTVTNLGGCTSIEVVEVITGASPVLPAYESEIVLCDADIPTLTLEVSTGQTIDWYDENGLLLVEGEVIFQPLDTGLYEAIVRDLITGCTSNESAQITILTDMIAPVFTFCPEDTSLILNIAVDTGLVVYWPEPLAIDNCSDVFISGDHDSGSVFEMTTDVNYQATDQEGNSAACNFTLDITLTDSLTFLVDTSGITYEDNLFTVPICVLDFEEVSGFQFSMLLSDSTDSFIESVEYVEPVLAANMGHQLDNDTTLRVLWAEFVGGPNSPVNRTLPDSTTIIAVKVRMMGDFGSCSQLVFQDDPIETAAFRADGGEVIPSHIDGDICIPEVANIEGHIYREDLETISEVEVSCISDDSTRITYTDDNGRYEFRELPLGIDYEIIPFLDINHRNGVSLVDLTIIREYLLIQDASSYLNSPYKRIAADVTNNEVVSLTDLTSLIALILGGPSAEFASNTSWRFVDAEYEFPDPTDPWDPHFPETRLIVDHKSDSLSNDFIGVKIGDVNLSAINLLTSPDLSLSVPNVEFSSGMTLSIPVRASNLNDVLGYQFEMGYDKEALELVAIEKGDVRGIDSSFFNLRHVDEGWLSHAWVNLEELSYRADERVLFYLQFEAKKNGRISQSLWLQEVDLVPMAVRSGHRPVSLVLDYKQHSKESAIPVTSDSKIKLLGAFPNPFREETQIRFYLPESDLIQLWLYDHSGKLIHKGEKALETGIQDWTVGEDYLNTKGMFYYRIVGSGGEVSGKLLHQ